MNDVLPAVFVVAVAGLAIALVVQAGAGRRARVAGDRVGEYRALAERAVAAQEATEKRLAELVEQLAAANQRVGAIERILKDAE